MNPPTEQHKIDALFSVGYEFQQSGRYHKAAGAYLETIKRQPNHAGACNNLGNCLRSLGKNQEALLHYNRALAIDPGKTSAKLNKSLALLALNRYEEAWPLYRHRLESISYRKEVLTSGKPEWDGRVLNSSQTLYLYSNQGLGDELQALRYIPLVTKRAQRVILEVQKPNYQLLKNLPGVKVTVRPDDKHLPDFDFQSEIFTLPEIFGTTFDTVPVPWRPPFEPSSNISGIITSEKEKFPDHLHVGIVWSGNPKNDLNRYRACGLLHLLPLLRIPGCRFYSLQKGIPRNDIRKHRDQIRGLIDLADHLTDMAATATAIDELDLVITTDTSIPHLAGTLGAKSWVLLHKPADWRWTLEGKSTPWYPQMRLFRQEEPGAWPELIKRVSAELTF